MKNNNKITTVLFDLDGTLREHHPSGFKFFMSYAASLGAPKDDDSQLKAIHWTHQYWTQSEELVSDIENFSRESDDFWNNYAYRQLKALGCEEKQAKQLAPQVNEYMVKEYLPEDRLYEGALETLGDLKDKGYTLGVVTNRRSPVDEYLSELGLAPYLDFNLYAGEIGYWKPKIEIFEHALSLAKSKPAETVYVGDNYFADVVGAKNANIEPVLFDPDNIFPDADCKKIKKLSEIKGIV